MRRQALVVAALLLVLAACGSCGGSESGSGATSTDVEAIIAAGLLRATDVPGSLRSAPSADTSDQLTKLAEGIPACRHFVAAERKGTHRRTSPGFTRDGVRSASSVDVYAGADAAAGQLDLYQDPGTPACIQAVVRAGLADVGSTGATLGTITVTPLPRPAFGDSAFAYRISIPITQLGRPAELVSDQVAASVGSSTVFVTSGLIRPLSLAGDQRQTLIDRLTELDDALAPKLIERMHAAGA